MLYAHLTKVRDGYRLTVGVDIRPFGQVYPVETKRQARALAKRLGAQPWNF